MNQKSYKRKLFTNNEWRIKHREYNLKRLREYRLNIKKEVLTHYGDGKARCVLCGFDKIGALCIDHINGGGNQHRKEIKMQGAGYNFYSWLIQNDLPEGYRTLCMNCNFLEKERLGMASRWHNGGRRRTF